MANRAKNFLIPKICQILSFEKAWRSEDMKSSDFFTAKGTSLRESTPSEPFCAKVG